LPERNWLFLAQPAAHVCINCAGDCLTLASPLKGLAAISVFYPARFADCAATISEVGKELYDLGWTPATSSNFSMRIDDAHIAITVSGRHKGRLTPDDVMVIDAEGLAVGTDNKPSAETLLHTHIYKRFPGTGAVLHTHSRAQTLASKLFEQAGRIVFEDYELLKARTPHAGAGVSQHPRHARLGAPN
jgi:ribulose-5-phosphate 4-epimerase/fuculose-1-phosphate aldolase